jgi:hypothetical protein
VHQFSLEESIGSIGAKQGVLGQGEGDAVAGLPGFDRDGTSDPAWADDKTDPATVPGRPVKVATIAIGFGGQREAKVKLPIEHLATAGKEGVDIACLPEEFAGTVAEPVPGPTTEAIAELARQYAMYVICPIREQAGERQYNTAVLLDRQGQIAGYYRKVFVYWFVHTNFNENKVPKLVREHAGEIEIERTYGAEAWWLLRAVKPGLRVRDLCRQYDIEPLRDYRHRSRRQINEARAAGRRI